MQCLLALVKVRSMLCALGLGQCSSLDGLVPCCNVLRNARSIGESEQ